MIRIRSICLSLPQGYKSTDFSILLLLLLLHFSRIFYCYCILLLLAIYCQQYLLQQYIGNILQNFSMVKNFKILTKSVKILVYEAAELPCLSLFALSRTFGHHKDQKMYSFIFSSRDGTNHFFKVVSLTSSPVVGIKENLFLQSDFLPEKSFLAVFSNIKRQ